MRAPTFLFLFVWCIFRKEESCERGFGKFFFSLSPVFSLLFFFFLFFPSHFLVLENTNKILFFAVCFLQSFAFFILFLILCSTFPLCFVKPTILPDFFLKSNSPLNETHSASHTPLQTFTSKKTLSTIFLREIKGGGYAIQKKRKKRKELKLRSAL